MRQKKNFNKSILVMLIVVLFIAVGLKLTSSNQQMGLETSNLDRVDQMKQNKNLCFSDSDCIIKCQPKSNTADPNSYTQNKFYLGSDHCTEIAGGLYPVKVICEDNTCKIKRD